MLRAIVQPYSIPWAAPLKGNLWETIAVPELREQAQALAATVLQSLPVRVRPVPPFGSTFRRSTEKDYGDPRSAIPQSTLLFRQFFDPESSTYTYLIADSLNARCSAGGYGIGAG